MSFSATVRPLLHRYLPLTRELTEYNSGKFRADVMAGLAVALVSLPQAVGFALIAGLPPQVVVTGVIVAGIVSAFFVSSRHAIIGPTNTTSIFVATIVASGIAPALNPVQTAIFIAFAVGMVQLAAGLVRAGNITQFVSRSVILGYGTGAAVLIAAGQLPTFLGVDVKRGMVIPTLVDAAEKLIQLEFNPIALAVGAGSLALMLLLQRARPAWPGGLLILIIVGLSSHVFRMQEEMLTVATLGGLARTMPVFAGAPLAMLSSLPVLVNAALALAIIGMLEAVSISKNIAATSAQRLDPNQELLGLGAGNLAASFFGAMPGSGSFVRSAINVGSGGQTQIGGIVSAAGLGLLVWVVAPLAAAIPLASVAAILLVVAAQMINHRHIRTVCRATRSDTVVFLTTFIGTILLHLDTAIYLGIGVSLALFLQKAASPSLVEYGFNDTGHLAALPDAEARPNPQISIIHVEGDLFFGAADLFQDEVRALAAQQDIRVFILRMKNARHLDGSTVLALDQLIAQLHAQGRHLLISGVHGDVARVLRRSGLIHRLGAENVFPAEENPTLATKRALQRAQVLLGGAKADVRIFYDRAKQPA